MDNDTEISPAMSLATPAMSPSSPAQKRMRESTTPVMSPATPAQKRTRESITETTDSLDSTTFTSSSPAKQEKMEDVTEKKPEKIVRVGASIWELCIAFSTPGNIWNTFNYPMKPFYPLTFVPTMSVPEYIAKYGSTYEDLHTSREENISLCGITMNKQIISPTMVVCDFFGLGPDKESSIKLILSKSDRVDLEFERFHSFTGSVMALGVSGYPGKCEGGQLCIFAKSCTLLAANPKPNAKSNPCWSEFKNVGEDRCPTLYLSIMRDKEVRQTFRIRNKIAWCIIRFFVKQYLFQEKPSVAKSFVNHHVAFSRALPHFMMWHSHLIGGFTHIFKIGKLIRSKGIDLAHVQDIITYKLYVDVNRNELMELTETVLSGVIKKLTGSYKMKCHANGLDKDPVEIDFEPPFSRIDLLEELEKLSLPKTIAPKLNELVKHILEKSVNPTFITYHPKTMDLMEKHHSLDSSLVEGFELFINRHEVFNGFVALDDPVPCIQKIMKIKDRELSEAEAKILEYGLIPTGTWGVGMDQLAMLITNSDNYEVLSKPLSSNGVIKGRGRATVNVQ